MCYMEVLYTQFNAKVMIWGIKIDINWAKRVIFYKKKCNFEKIDMKSNKNESIDFDFNPFHL